MPELVLLNSAGAYFRPGLRYVDIGLDTCLSDDPEDDTKIYPIYPESARCGWFFNIEAFRIKGPQSATAETRNENPYM